MSTWTVKRAVILGVALLVGILVMPRVFSSNPSEAVVPTLSPTPSIPGPSHPSPTTSKKKGKVKVQGVVVQVLNGSGQTALGAELTQTLQAAGYTTLTPGTVPTTSTTVVYYKPGMLASAENLQLRYVPGADLKPATSDIPSQVQIAVVMGTDYQSA